MYMRARALRSRDQIRGNLRLRSCRQPALECGMFRHLSDDKIQVSIRPPLIYFDHCAIRGTSSDPAKSARLKEIFETRGTLMFSVINMIEMAANSGRSYDQIRTMLDGLGP